MLRQQNHFNFKNSKLNFLFNTQEYFGLVFKNDQKIEIHDYHKLQEKIMIFKTYLIFKSFVLLGYFIHASL